MSFRVHPDPPLDGLIVRPSATTPPIPFADPSPSGGTVFIRCAVFGSDCSAPSAPSPDVFVVGDGDEDQVTSVGGVNPTPVAGGRAFATISPGARGVFLIRIFKDAGSPISWQLRFRNPAADASMRLMWVVADTESDSQQPWITVRAPSPLLLDARPGEQVTASLQLQNHGTAPLVVSDAVGAAATPGLGLSEVPPPVAANSCATLRLTFTGQAEPSSRRLDWIVPSNDATALTEWDEDLDEPPTHTGRVELEITSHPRMPTLNTGDILVVDSPRIVRVDPSNGLQTEVVSGGLGDWAWDVAVEASGNLLFTTQDSLVRMERQSGSLRVVSEGGSLQNARSLAVANDGSILVVNSGVGSITRVHPQSGTQEEVFAGGIEGGPIALARDGFVFMSAGEPFHGVQTGTLVRVHLPTRAAVPILRKPGFGLEGVAVGPDSAVFVVANQFFHEEHQLIRIDPQSGTPTTIFNQPDILLRRVIVTRSGDVFVTATPWPNPFPFEGLVLRLSPNGGGGQWDSTPVSVGNLMRGPAGLVVVPSPSG